jgi:hypothetical protein
MKHGFLVLLVAVVIGVVGALVTRHVLKSSPTSWLCQKYELSPEKSCRIEALQKEYGSKCGPFCDQMCQANAHLEQVALDIGLGQGSITPTLREAVAKTDRIRTETRITMLEHFYAVAAELPPDKRREYLLKVLPLVIDSCGSK